MVSDQSPATGSAALREDAIEAICRRTGKTREQAIAFLDVLGSAFTRRGLADGRVLSEDEIGERVETFIGKEDQ